MILYVGNKLEKHGFSVTSIETLGVKIAEEGFEIKYTSDKLNQLGRLFDMLSTLFRYRKSVEIVIIDTYSQKAFAYAFLVGVFCQFLNKKYIPILRGGKLPNTLDKHPNLSKRLFLNSYVNVAPSGYLAHAFQSKGYPVYLIPNFIDIDKYVYLRREKCKMRLLWVRSFDRVYNPELAIHLVDQLIKKGYDPEICMIGPDKDGSMENCKILANELGVSEAVVFTGKLSKEDWHKKSVEYDIFINTTNYDNTPISVIEAMALGLPVISTNVGGIPYLLEDGEDAILVEPRNTVQLVKAVENICQSDNLALKLSLNGRKKVESFGWSIVKEQWISLLKSI